ncbi:hypothetical protein K439DRAFT_1615300, partial [Ramaria rubella]
MHPKQARIDNQTISGYWEIGGVRAHCLLDSRCEGVMLSPNFIRAVGIKTFEIECPIGLQLACVSSMSTINYGAHTNIHFGEHNIKEYFDIANIDYYNAILGTPFLCKLGISLDFRGEGCIHMGKE